LYRHLEARLTQHFRIYLKRTYDVDLQKIVVELPPRVELGEYALPLAFELAKKLRKAPKKIADEIVAGVGVIEGFTKLEVARAGYILRPAKSLSSTRASIPTKPPTLAISGTRFSATHSYACFALPSAKWMSRTTLTTPAPRSRMLWLVFRI
jgi:hypothetical protein